MNMENNDLKLGFEIPEVTFEEIHAGLAAYFSHRLNTQEADSLQFEIRLIGVDKTIRAAFFDLSEEGLLSAANMILLEQANPSWQGTFATVNPANKTEFPRGAFTSTGLTKDEHIPGGHCTFVLLDVDPIKNNPVLGQSNATPNEKAYALASGDLINQMLESLGLRATLTASSGNGFHAMYPVKGITKVQHQRFLQFIAKKWSTIAPSELLKKINVDKSVYNPARLMRVPGSLGRKGGDDITRPAVVKSQIINRIDWSADLAQSNQTAVEKILTTEEVAHETGYQYKEENYSANTDFFQKRALNYIKILCNEKPAISGQGGHNTTFANLCKLVQRFDMLRTEKLWELAIYYNVNGTGGELWSESELKHKFEDALKSPRAHPSYSEQSDAPLIGETRVSVVIAEGTNPSASGYQHLADLSDQGNAQRMLQHCGHDLLFVAGAWQKWMTWNGIHWVIDETNTVQVLFKQSVDANISKIESALEKLKTEKPASKTLNKNEGEKELEKALSFLSKSRNMDKLRAGISSAQSENVTIPHTILNGCKNKIACKNGTIDLLTGQLISSSREDYLTQAICTEYYPEASCPNWVNFLWQILIDPTTKKPDYELINYVQKLLGLALTGNATTENIFPIFFGAGGNGKSTFINTIQEVLGNSISYGADPKFLMETRHQEHPTALASVHGKRLIITQEPSPGSKLDTSLIKSLTGGDQVGARKMREDFWFFTPQALIVLVSNELPLVRETTDGIWRRIVVIPFLAKFLGTDRDPLLKEKLLAEKEGILRWLVDGAVHYSKEGLTPPPTVHAASANYRAEENVAARWLADCAVLEDGARTQANAIQQSFHEWLRIRGIFLTNKAKYLSDELQKISNVVKDESGNFNSYHGIRLLGTSLRDW
jgi:P4 family phage/plasmid primase-like protien